MYCKNCGQEMYGDGINCAYYCSNTGRDDAPDADDPMDINIVYDCTSKHVSRILESAIETTVSDVIAFGAAIGSWHDSGVAWHCRAAEVCVEAIKTEAIRELKGSFGRLSL